MEFKQPDRFSASVVRLKFRAGQVPQLEGWLASGAVSVVLTIHRNILYVHSADMAGRLADGVTQEEFEDTALSMLKTRGRWKEVVEEIILVAETL